MTSNIPSNKTGTISVSDGVLINLRRIIQSVDLHSRQLARQHGITTPQLLILKQIQGETGMTVSQLANQISLKQATVTDILNRLERKGLIRRCKDTGDRRRVLIEETAAGQKLLDAAPSPLQETFLEKFEELETWQQSMILSSLQLLVTVMVEEDISAAPILSTGALTDKVELTYENNAAQKEGEG